MTEGPPNQGRGSGFHLLGCSNVAFGGNDLARSCFLTSVPLTERRSRDSEGMVLGDANYSVEGVDLVSPVFI